MCLHSAYTRASCAHESFLIRRHTPLSPYVAPRFPHMSEMNSVFFVFFVAGVFGIVVRSVRRLVRRLDATEMQSRLGDCGRAHVVRLLHHPAVEPGKPPPHTHTHTPILCICEICRILSSLGRDSINLRPSI